MGALIKTLTQVFLFFIKNENRSADRSPMKIELKLTKNMGVSLIYGVIAACIVSCSLFVMNTFNFVTFFIILVCLL